MLDTWIESRFALDECRDASNLENRIAACRFEIVL